jgi:ABC-type oligopeptide transport system substrate-binding subunit
MKKLRPFTLLLLVLTLFAGLIPAGCGDNATAPPPEERKQSPAEQQVRQGKDG